LIKPLIIGLGHKAGHGKDTVAGIIAVNRRQYNVQFVNFADGLRRGLNAEMFAWMRLYGCSYHRALKNMCEQRGVPFDPDAKADLTYPFTKQRSLLQHDGHTKRESRPDYWVRKWVDVVRRTEADVILCTDVRYPNELSTLRDMGAVPIRVYRPDFNALSQEAARHVSETALDGAKFDYTLVNDGTLEHLQDIALTLFDHLMENHR
jgi:hypothetical protein